MKWSLIATRSPSGRICKTMVKLCKQSTSSSSKTRMALTVAALATAPTALQTLKPQLLQPTVPPNLKVEISVKKNPATGFFLNLKDNLTVFLQRAFGINPIRFANRRYYLSLKKGSQKN